MIDDRNLEKSVVTLFEGMNFFIEIALEQKLNFHLKQLENILYKIMKVERIYILI